MAREERYFMTPKTEKPREFWLQQGSFRMMCVKDEKGYEDWTHKPFKVIEYSAVTELARRLNLANSNYDSINKACNEWEQSCYNYVKANKELEQRLRVSINSGENILKLLETAQEKVKSLESEVEKDNRQLQLAYDKIKELDKRNAFLEDRKKDYVELCSQYDKQKAERIELEAENQKLRELIGEKSEAAKEAFTLIADKSVERITELENSNQTLAAKLKVAVEQRNEKVLQDCIRWRTLNSIDVTEGDMDNQVKAEIQEYDAELAKVGEK